MLRGRCCVCVLCSVIGLFLAWLLLVQSPPAALSQGKGPVSFINDVAPILKENCFACHGPDSAARTAGLRLDLRDVAVATEAIVPGQLEKSLLIERIFSNEASHVMPPPKSHKKLTAAQKETLKRWIAAGAEYQPHWSFLAPQRAQLPAVKNGTWIRNPIDRFILAALEQR